MPSTISLLRQSQLAPPVWPGLSASRQLAGADAVKASGPASGSTLAYRLRRQASGRQILGMSLPSAPHFRQKKQPRCTVVSCVWCAVSRLPMCGPPCRPGSAAEPANSLGFSGRPAVCRLPSREPSLADPACTAAAKPCNAQHLSGHAEGSLARCTELIMPIAIDIGGVISKQTNGNPTLNTEYDSRL